MMFKYRYRVNEEIYTAESRNELMQMYYGLDDGQIRLEDVEIYSDVLDKYIPIEQAKITKI